MSSDSITHHNNSNYQPNDQTKDTFNKHGAILGHLAVWPRKIDNKKTQKISMKLTSCFVLQVYFQRVLSCQSPSHARMLSFTASFGCLLSAVPACIIGAVAKATGNTSSLPPVCQKLIHILQMLNIKWIEWLWAKYDGCPNPVNVWFCRDASHYHSCIHIINGEHKCGPLSMTWRRK